MSLRPIVTEKRVLSVFPSVYLAVFFLIPLVLMAVIAFRIPGDYGGLKPIVENSNVNLTWSNLSYVFTNSFIWQLVWRSIVYSFITTVICLLLGFPVALLIAKSKARTANLLLLLVIIPFWSNFLIRVYAWMILLGPQSALSKVINGFLGVFHLSPVSLMYNDFSVILCLVYVSLPFMILPLYTNLEKHEDSLIEASRDLGASKWVSFFKITVPLAIPGIVTGSALVFIPCMGMFVIPDLVGGKCSMMIGNLIKLQFLEIMNWPLGSMTSIFMTVIILLFGFILVVAIRRIFKGVFHVS